MNPKRYQFKLRSLILVAVAFIALLAFWENPSLPSYVFLTVGACVFVLGCLPKYWKFPVLVGGAVGFSVATLLLLVFVGMVVVEAPRYQGQLYHEDGPEAFFVVSLIFWCIGSVAATLFGMLMGVVIELFALGVAKFESETV
jgi:cell division protein FtsW (lipid II flippase)